MDWKIIENRLTKTYKAKTFSEIMSKLNALEKVANASKHHPDFTVFEYNKIRFELWTHSAKSVTSADYKMAEHIDSIFAK